MKRIVVLTLAVVLAGAAVAQAASVYFAGANGGRHSRPRTLWLSGDGTLDVFKVHWSSWGGAVAVAHGTAEYHGCTPTCAAAPDHHAAVTVRLSNIRSCPNGSFYTHVSLTLPSGRLLDRNFLRTSWKPC